MPLAKKAEGYPVEAGAAATAVAEPAAPAAATPAATSAPREIKSKDNAAVQPSAKDRSIVRQVSWKVAGFALANWTGSPEQWFETAKSYVEKIEKHIHEA